MAKMRWHTEARKFSHTRDQYIQVDNNSNDFFFSLYHKLSGHKIWPTNGNNMSIRNWNAIIKTEWQTEKENIKNIYICIYTIYIPVHVRVCVRAYKLHYRWFVNLLHVNKLPKQQINCCCCCCYFPLLCIVNVKENCKKKECNQKAISAEKENAQRQKLWQYNPVLERI